MARDAQYFSHDFGARNDPKMIRLRREKKMAGVGLFWCIIELLTEEGGFLALRDIPSIAYDLHVKPKEITELLENFELFSQDSEKFWSDSVIRRLDKKDEKSQKAKISAEKRWKRNANASNKNANALPTHDERNAEKEREDINERKETKESGLEGFLNNPFPDEPESPVAEPKPELSTQTNTKVEKVRHEAARVREWAKSTHTEGGVTVRFPDPGQMPFPGTDGGYGWLADLMEVWSGFRHQPGDGVREINEYRSQGSPDPETVWKNATWYLAMTAVQGSTFFHLKNWLKDGLWKDDWESVCMNDADVQKKLGPIVKHRADMKKLLTPDNKEYNY